MVSLIKLPANWGLVSNQNKSNITFSLGNNPIVSQWIYALVAPFPTLTDNVLANDLTSFWRTGTSVNIHATKFVLTDQIASLLTAVWGTPAMNLVEILSANDLLDAAWDTIGTLSIIPFEDIAPKWKVISIDGQSPVRKEFDPNKYALSLNFTLSVSDPEIEFQLPNLASTEIASIFPKTNRDANKLTTVIVTGTTALVRDTARLMEQNGLTFPAVYIRDILRQADILHISNEIAFSNKCPFPDPKNPILVFCSRPQYIQLLEDIGTDVVDMTGDHFIDASNEDILNTIQMYKDHGWGYYAAGANIEEARKPLLLDNHGNKIAFEGCNAKPTGYSGATNTLAGTWHCDWSYLDQELPSIEKSGYLTIMTFSHLEYYQYIAVPALITDFHHAADDGAVIVSGSQAHQPQAMEFYKNSFLHYGLGNLFFDQYNEWPDSRKSFIDRHVFYNGKYISTELITIMFINNAQSRLMTKPERDELLTTVFEASQWKVNP
jgi:poly-gamma-glutamate synthesis protein (capsule biosynthesis protein)